MDKQSIPLLLQVLLYGLPMLIALFGAWRKWARPRIAPYLRGITSLGDIGEMQDDIRAIRKEVTTNGGGSLKDGVNRIEISLRHSTAMQRAHFANNAEGQFETDGDGKLTWANETLQRWTGCTLVSLRGRGWRSVIAEADQARFLDAVDIAVRDRREFRGQCAMRTTVPPGPNGEPGKVQHLSTDWRLTVVRDPVDALEVIGYSGNVRRHAPTSELPAIRPATPPHLREDNGA